MSVPAVEERVPTKVCSSMMAVFSSSWRPEWDGELSLSVGDGFARVDSVEGYAISGWFNYGRPCARHRFRHAIPRGHLDTVVIHGRVVVRYVSLIIFLFSGRINVRIRCSRRFWYWCPHNQKFQPVQVIAVAWVGCCVPRASVSISCFMCFSYSLSNESPLEKSASERL